MLWLALPFAPGTSTAADETSRYGKSLVRSYDLPAELLDRYNQAMSSQAAAGSNTFANLES